MPRNEKVLPSRRPRTFPHSSWSTGGFRLAPVAGAAAGRAGAWVFGFSCPKALPATPATAPRPAPWWCRASSGDSSDPTASSTLRSSYGLSSCSRPGRASFPWRPTRVHAPRYPTPGRTLFPWPTITTSPASSLHQRANRRRYRSASSAQEMPTLGSDACSSPARTLIVCTFRKRRAANRSAASRILNTKV